MSERPTAEQLRELRAWADDVATTQQSAKPRTYRRALTTLALLDACEATQRPVEPSAHRSEQAAPPADPLEGRRPWLDVGHNGDEPEAPQVEHECGDDCMPARNLHFRTAAPPADEHDAPPLRRATDAAPPADDVRALAEEVIALDAQCKSEDECLACVRGVGACRCVDAVIQYDNVTREHAPALARKLIEVMATLATLRAKLTEAERVLVKEKWEVEHETGMRMAAEAACLELVDERDAATARAAEAERLLRGIVEADDREIALMAQPVREGRETDMNRAACARMHAIDAARQSLKAKEPTDGE